MMRRQQETAQNQPYLNRFIQPDTLVPSPTNPQAWNKYSYTENNPIKYIDPTGHWVETAFDVISLGMTINDIKNEGFTFWNTVSLVTDVASIVLPAVPAGASHVIRAAKYANKAVNVADTAADTVKTAGKLDNLWDSVKNFLKNNNCSFSADTQVATLEGSESIAVIEIGDYVLAWNEADGTLGYYQVTDTFSHTDEILTYLNIDGEWIETTPEHPFYVEGKGWTEADSLRTGDKIRQADGATGRVWLKWNVYKTREMYNLTVDTAHTFFVGEGQWLVHNTCNPLDNLPKRSTKDKTSGILIAGGEEIPLTSGVNGPARLMPRGQSGYDIVTRTHVEGHAAALMWQNGWDDGILFINNPPCVSCSRWLPSMLPPNSSLRVIAPNFKKTFIGMK